MQVKPLDIEVGCPSESGHVVWQLSLLRLPRTAEATGPAEAWQTIKTLCSRFSVFSSMSYRRKSFVLPGRRLFQEATSVRECVSECVSERRTQPPAACDCISTVLQSELPLNTHNPMNDKRTLQTWHKWGRNNRLIAGRCQFVQREHITQVR